MNLFRRSPWWPVTLRDDSRAGSPSDAVILRPLTRADERDWLHLRALNAEWLGKWDATTPEIEPDGLVGPAVVVQAPRRGRPIGPVLRAPRFPEYVNILETAARDGSTLPFAIEIDGELVGQLTVSSITYGSLCSASIGYWVSEHVAGRGITPTAVAMAADYCFFELGLHRIEVNIRPENAPSLRVAEKLGLRDEGLRRGYLHIQGVWRDHRAFALTADEVPEGLLARWRAAPRAGTGVLRHDAR
ncbi:GNAT family N-acetyltransferase [Sanguibacter antarcticus]|uniref:Ribosomal-protein-alanine N-acetyltransferase n=1 Tax=Sanguibacter antarcticus TaxID=372484 RepID=A0A2A9E043_9MICO|nr:GNAT family protein [Sanguibacter antarcticus]PFG32308.1 ribosomal-protein-alanine N-acetyltransferase [Sanguibacter antarcticus]